MSAFMNLTNEQKVKVFRNVLEIERTCGEDDFIYYYDILEWMKSEAWKGRAPKKILEVQNLRHTNYEKAYGLLYFLCGVNRT